jgi:hypothetical protein
MGVQLLLALLLALLGYYVWPTPYRFYSANGRLAGIMGYRENRLTGSLDVLTKEGWMPMTGADTTQPMTNAAPAAHARLDSANLLTTVGRSRQRERDSVNQAKRHRAR